MKLTYKFRLSDKHATELNRQARAVNFIWNYCNEAQRHMRRWDRWLSSFDLMKLTANCSKELDVHSHTIQRVCKIYVDARCKSHKARLRWRGAKSLGWVPFNTGHATFDGKLFKFRNRHYQTMHLREMHPGVKIGAGSFNQDSRGRWYLNCQIEIEEAISAPNTRVGVDLGLHTLASMSDGGKIWAPQFYRKNEAFLATAQRARKTKRVKAIHAKVANRRRDFLHKESTRLTKQYGLIIVGDVSPSKLAKTMMAKSALDAGWADFKNMLRYKSIRNGGSTIEVSEAYSSQVCSTCGALPASRPKGIADLGIREWACDYCGTVHDRDCNAAKNILRSGLATLVEGTRQNGGSQLPRAHYMGNCEHVK